GAYPDTHSLFHRLISLFIWQNGVTLSDPFPLVCCMVIVIFSSVMIIFDGTIYYNSFVAE
ncbi:MAG TPA: hypothetical protein DEO95_05215, partial [Ruminococcaceae bacterium]|nr:hypothetical protein [Oscillospiraceae bacterium]